MYRTIAIDVETFLITRARPAPLVVCLSFANDNNADVIPHGAGLRAWLIDCLNNNLICFVGHNVAYDFKCIAASYPDLLPLIFHAYKNNRITDTGIRQQLFDIAIGQTYADDMVKGYSLSDLHKRIFGTELEGKEGEDIWRKRYGELYNVPVEKWPAAAIEYSRHDAEVTFNIWREQEKVAAIFRDDTFQTYAAFCLTLIESYGMRTDPGALRAIKKHYEKIIEVYRPRLLEVGLLNYKKSHGYTKSLKEARRRIEVACAAQDIEPYRTDKGNTSTDKAACYLSQDPLMIDRAVYANAEKMLSTYYEFLKEGVDLPITTRYGLAATARTTSSAPRPPAIGGNLQNMPRAFGPRECVVPRAGKIFLSGDFSGAELHTLAQVCKYKLGYSVLGDTLNAGRDVHLLVAANMLGISYEEAVERKRNGDPEIKQTRQDAKPVDFGFPGGMGIKTFIKMQLKEGHFWKIARVKAFKGVWFDTFPEMREYFEINKHELGPKGKAQIELFYSRRLRTVHGFPTICNTYFQSLTADGAKLAIVEVLRRAYVEPNSLLYGARAVNFVHDDLMLEIDDDSVRQRDKVATEFATVMANEFNKVVPDYPTTVDVVLMRRWHKAAETVIDQDGKLIPWEMES